MKFKLILNIALHLITARLKQTMVAAAGVTFGIAMFITLNGFMNGLNEMLDGLMLNRTPHVRLYKEVKANETTQPYQLSEKYKNKDVFLSSLKPKDDGKEIKNSREIIRTLKNDQRIIDVAPKLTFPAFFVTGSIELSGIIYGIDTDVEDKLFNISDNIIQGKLSDLNMVSNSVIIGKGLAEKLMAVPGDMIRVALANGEVSTLKVIGISQIGIAEMDNTMCYTSLRTSQKLLGVPESYVTDIQMKVKDISLAPAMAKEFAAEFGTDAIDIQRANAQFETGSSVRSTISYVVGFTLLLVAGFGIYNILNMMIYEKMDSIAILKATGFSGFDVKMIFISLSLIIGTVGGIIGLLFGYLLSALVDGIPFNTDSLPTIKTYPVVYQPVYYFVGLIFALCTTFLAGFMPARKASKVDPVEIIRGK